MSSHNPPPDFFSSAGQYTTTGESSRLDGRPQLAPAPYPPRTLPPVISDATRKVPYFSDCVNRVLDWWRLRVSIVSKLINVQPGGSPKMEILAQHRMLLCSSGKHKVPYCPLKMRSLPLAVLRSLFPHLRGPLLLETTQVLLTQPCKPRSE